MPSQERFQLFRVAHPHCCKKMYEPGALLDTAGHRRMHAMRALNLILSADPIQQRFPAPPPPTHPLAQD